MTNWSKNEDTTNIRWYKGLTKGRWSLSRAFQTAVNSALLLMMLGLMVSGIILSHENQKLSQETINIINIKCHDLKYRLTQIPRATDSDQKEYIRDVSDALTIYETPSRRAATSMRRTTAASPPGM